MLSARLWRNGPFLRFFTGASLSVVGDWFNTVALTVLTYRLTGQVALVAAMIAASVLPRVLLGPLGGALADRFERRGLLVTLDIARAIVSLLPLLVHDASHLWLMYVAVAILQAGACVYNPAQGAYVSYIVPDDLLEGANAAYATMRDIGMFAGPAMAAIVLGAWGPPAAFVGNSLSFVVAAGLLLTLPRVAIDVQTKAKLGTLITGYAAIARRYPCVSALCAAYLATSVLIYFFLAVMVVYARALGQPTTFVGTLYASAGLGGAIGGLAMGQYLRRLPYGAAISIYVLSVPLLGALSIVHNAALALVLFACSTAAATAGDIVFTVTVQRYVSPTERGRAFGLLFWCIAIGQLLGAALGISVTANVAASALLWVGIATFPVVLAGVTLSIRASYAPVALSAGAVADGI